MQKRPRGRVAAAALDRHLIGARTFLLGPVEIGVIGQTGLTTGGDIVLDQPMQPLAVATDEERPALPAPDVGPCLIVLDRAIGGQNLVPAPAGVARRLPIV